MQHLIDAGKKTKEMELYRKFIRTQNFVHWFKHRKRQALHHIRTKYLKSLEDADIARHAKKMNEVEVVDMYLRVSEILVRSVCAVWLGLTCSAEHERVQCRNQAESH